MPDRTAEVSFNYAPPAARVPSPEETSAAPLPIPATLKYAFKLARAGGFTVTAGGERYPFESTFSYPGGGENALRASRKRDRAGDGLRRRVRGPAQGRLSREDNRR